MAAAGKSPIEPHLPFSCLAIGSSAPSNSASFTASVASPPSVSLNQWNLDRRHIFVLNCTACVAAISASWLFFCAIPALLAFKRAAESLEKLLDVTAEELPDTMAAVRLSGMEISDLTMELSDLGQEITQGVKRSTRAVRAAEDGLRRLTTMAPIVPVQGKTTQKDEPEGPVVASTARNMREGIAKGRAIFGVIFSVTQISRWVFNFLAARGRKKTV